MISVLTCIFVEHDLRLVVVAAVICATACSAALGFHLKCLRAGGRATRLAWMALTGLVAGSGVWATHFIAELAYKPHLPIGYDISLTVLSLAIAIVGMGAGFALPVLQRTRAVAISGGALTGFAVAAMHFTGMAAVRTQASIEWSYPYVFASIAIGAAGAAAAFYARTRLKGRAEWSVPALIMVLSIVGLHFTAMTAVRLIPNPALAAPAELLGRGALALATVTLAGAILTAAVSLIWMENVGRRNTLGGLKGALDALSAAFAFYDSAGRLVSWNRAFSALMASAGVEVGSGTTHDAITDAVVAAGWRPQAGQPDRRQARREGRPVEPLNVELPDGRWLRHEVFITPDGGHVSVMTDITQEHETSRALSEARDHAEAANRAKSQFLANMSHEIRTPLNGVLGVADVLGGTALDPRQQELVGVIRTSGALLNALLTDLLDLARVEAGVAELNAEPTDLAELAESVRGLYAARAEQKGLSLTLEMDAGVDAWVACDGLRLRQVLGNLVSNAVKFTEAGEVAIGVTREGERVTFQVRDTGPGFDEELKARLFGRFQQADDTSTRKHGGAGLGLAICQEYVRLMGGELDAVSRPGAGATFWFTLTLPPLAAPQAPEAVTAEDRPAGRFRVLVVDDNAVNRQVLGLILDSVGVEHAAADDGRQALDAAMTGGFDAVLMDIQMPVMDGLESTRRIRAWEASAGRARMPIFIVSANCLQEHVDAGLQAGADAHLSKPVSVPKLVAMLEPHAAAAAAEAA